MVRTDMREVSLGQFLSELPIHLDSVRVDWVSCVSSLLLSLLYFIKKLNVGGTKEAGRF